MLTLKTARYLINTDKTLGSNRKSPNRTISFSRKRDQVEVGGAGRGPAHRVNKRWKEENVSKQGVSFLRECQNNSEYG